MSTALKIWATGDEVLAADLNGNFEGHKIQVLAGETLDGTPVPQPVCILSDIFQREYRAESNHGDVTGNTRRAVRIIPRGNVTSSTIKMILSKVGSPTGNLTIEVQTNSAGSPSGTPITNGTSNTVAMSGLTTSYAETTFTFASAFSLSAGTTYWVVLKRSDAVNSSNYVKVLSITNDYASFVGKKYDGSSWTAGDLMYFDMTPASGSSYTAWRSDADLVGLHWFDGFAISDAASAGNNVSVQTSGLVTGFTGLSPTKKYFVSDTVGTISETVGTYETGVGRSISETSILIERYSDEYIGSASLTQDSASPYGASGHTVFFSGARFCSASASLSGTAGTSSQGRYYKVGHTSTGEQYSSDYADFWYANYIANSSMSNDMSNGSNRSISGTNYFYR